MKFGDLLAKEREFVLRSLALCGMKIIVPISTIQGRFKLSENELADQEIKEIHLMDGTIEGIAVKLEELGFVKKSQLEKWTVYVPRDEMLHCNNFSGTFTVGNIVIVNKPFRGEPAGLKAFIFEHNTAMDMMAVINERGTILTCFTEKEQHADFIFLRDTGVQYKFTSREKLTEDFKKSIFKLLND